MPLFPYVSSFGPPSPLEKDLDMTQEGVDFLTALPLVVGLWQIMLPLLAGGAVLGLCAWACERAGKALNRQYRIRMRRGYYWFESREEEARRRFAEACRETYGSRVPDQRSYCDILQEFHREMSEIAEEIAAISTSR